MARGKILAVCQSGGEFTKEKDGTMSYSGGEAHAIDIERDMPLDELKSELSTMFNFIADEFIIKYFLPHNKRTLITISNNKDLQRMVDFHGESLTTDIYIVKKDERRMIVSVVADSDTPTTPADITNGTIDTIKVKNKAQKVQPDWDNLITGVGQVFTGPKALREALHKYAIANSFMYRFVKNDNSRVTAECTAPDCPWRIHASKTPNLREFEIRKWNDTHTCGRRASKDHNRLANQRWVASVIKDKLRDTPDYKPKDIANDLHREYGLSLNYTQAWRGKFYAKQELHSSHEEACSQLPWFCERILDTNPGSVATLETLEGSKFRFFVAFHASLSGFEHGCRPLLFLDSVHLKASKQWKLLVASGVDGDDSIFPFGLSVVDKVTPKDWHWFLLQLKLALSTSRTITFVSNHKDGLEEVVNQVFEDSCHGYCVSQLIKDFKAQFEEVEEELTQEVMEAMLGDLRRAVQACKVEEFNECIDSIKAQSIQLADWVLSTRPDLWSNAFFKGLRYGNYSSIASETFNSWVSTRYEPSVVQLVDMIRCKMMEMIYTRREASNSWREILTPSTNVKVQEDMVKARGLEVICSTGSVFEVNGESNNVVDIETWECTCRGWQVTGMPCVHALAVFDRTGVSMCDYFSKYFTAECYRLVYSLSIIPIPDAGRPGLLQSADTPEASSSPPPRRSRRMAGRPKERPDDPRITVKRAIRCGKCQGVGHNKQTCKASL